MNFFAHSNRCHVDGNDGGDDGGGDDDGADVCEQLDYLLFCAVKPSKVRIGQLKVI